MFFVSTYRSCLVKTKPHKEPAPKRIKYDMEAAESVVKENVLCSPWSREVQSLTSTVAQRGHALFFLNKHLFPLFSCLNHKFDLQKV